MAHLRGSGLGRSLSPWSGGSKAKGSRGERRGWRWQSGRRWSVGAWFGVVALAQVRTSLRSSGRGHGVGVGLGRRGARSLLPWSGGSKAKGGGVRGRGPCWNWSGFGSSAGVTEAACGLVGEGEVRAGVRARPGVLVVLHLRGLVLGQGSAGGLGRSRVGPPGRPRGHGVSGSAGLAAPASSPASAVTGSGRSGASSSVIGSRRPGRRVQASSASVLLGRGPSSARPRPRCGAWGHGSLW